MAARLAELGPIDEPTNMVDMVKDEDLLFEWAWLRRHPSAHTLFILRAYQAKHDHILWMERNHRCFVYMLVLILFSVLPFFFLRKKKACSRYSSYILNINICTLLVYAASNDCVLCKVYCLLSQSVWVIYHWWLYGITQNTIPCPSGWYKKFMLVCFICNTYCSAIQTADVAGTIKRDCLQWKHQPIGYGRNLVFSYSYSILQHSVVSLINHC